MANANPFVRIADRYDGTPPRLRPPLVTQAVGEVIPFVDTAGCFVEAYTPRRVAVRLDNEERLHNHLGGLHAIAVDVALTAPDDDTTLVAGTLTWAWVPEARLADEGER